MTIQYLIDPKKNFTKELKESRSLFEKRGLTITGINIGSDVTVKTEQLILKTLGLEIPVLREQRLVRGRIEFFGNKETDEKND